MNSQNKRKTIKEENYLNIHKYYTTLFAFDTYTYIGSFFPLHTPPYSMMIENK